MMVAAADASTAASHNGEVSAEPPRRGRPRSADADQAILEATLAVAGELGFRGMSMDLVAERAGVSKTTIYRRWSSKEALVLEALRKAINPLDDVDLGSVRADLETYLGNLGERMSTGQMSDVLPHLIDVSVHDPQLRCSLDDYVSHRRRPLVAILERGQTRGELRDGIDISIVVDALIGPFIYRKLLTGGPVGRQFTSQLLDVVLPGVLTDEALG
jgi:AcrR family transcriptional regulator